MALGLKVGTVTLVDYDPEWESMADKIIERLWRVFGSVAKDIQHFGSTSIRGIKAKPSISIAVAVDDIELAASLVPLVEREGFIIDCERRENELKIVVYSDQTRSVEQYAVLVMRTDSSKFGDLLRFRDYLNANSDTAKKYEACKLEAAKKAPSGRSAYKKNKKDFMEQILKEAATWASAKK